MKVGSWILAINCSGLEPKLQKQATLLCPALYAFTVDGGLTYVGKTVRPLLQRLRGYQWPSMDPRSGASTNRENHSRIVTALRSAQRVDILVFSGQESLRHVGFQLDLPAALEEAMIAEFMPPWNKQRRSGRLAVKTLRTTRPNTPPGTAVKSLDEGQNMTLTATVLLNFARTQQGSVLYTLKERAPFRVEAIGDSFEFLLKSGKARREGKAGVEAVLKAFNEKESWKTSDYTELTFNASYLLAVLKAMSDSHGQCRKP